MLSRTRSVFGSARRLSTKSIPPPKLFDYKTVVANVHVSDAIGAVEKAFGELE